jgi:hypothetical protein
VGDGPVAGVLAVLIVAGVAYITFSRGDRADALVEPALADEPA